MLRGYFDDSGTHTGGTTGPSRIVVVAGFLADDQQWDRFNDTWLDILRRYSLPYFHMAAFEAGRQQYEGMTDSDRATLLDQLLRTISVRQRVPVASGVVTSDYDSVLTDWEKRRYGKPYSFASQIAWMGIRVWADQRGYDEPIPFVFEDGTLHKGQVMWAFDKTETRPTLRRLYRLHSLKWGDKTSFPPLQAADILAYTVYRVMDANLGGRLPSRWSEMVATKIRYLRRAIADARALRSMVNDLNADHEASKADSR